MHCCILHRLAPSTKHHQGILLKFQETQLLDQRLPSDCQLWHIPSLWKEDKVTLMTSVIFRIKSFFFKSTSTAWLIFKIKKITFMGLHKTITSENGALYALLKIHVNKHETKTKLTQFSHGMLRFVDGTSQRKINKRTLLQCYDFNN